MNIEYKIVITVTGEETIHVDDCIKDIEKSRIGAICSSISLFKRVTI